MSPNEIGVKEKIIKVKLKKDLATREMMDAQLGKSVGMRTRMDKENVNKELSEVLDQRMHKTTYMSTQGNLTTNPVLVTQGA